MNQNYTLEFHTVLVRLAGFAMSEGAGEKLLALQPSLNESQCRNNMHETTEARKMLDAVGNPPLAMMKELDPILSMVRQGVMLFPEQLVSISQFLSSCRRMKAYLRKSEFLNVDIAFYGGAFHELNELHAEIERSIRNGMVDSSASPALHQVRRKLENAAAAVKTKLADILRRNKAWFADGYVTTRSGRFVLPVKKEYKNQVDGTVIEASGTGSTYFIEPASVRKLQDEITALQLEEEDEIRKILCALTALVEEQIVEIEQNRGHMETLDFIFAKAKLSAQMQAIPVPLTTDRRIIIRQGRHPLLKQESCIPLDFQLGGDYQGIVITGPNTGGKTVALKTVGLLSLMAQSGLHVPAAEGTSFCMNNAVLCDIGDGQSIAENLSTFSSHLTGIIQILERTTDETLVLLDELGSGTDPAEGMGLAIAILDELRRKNCLFVATTHYPQVKEFATQSKGLINARMEFDRDTLKPLYSLSIGEAGESCALHIAERLGFPPHMLKRAYAEAYKPNGTPLPEEAHRFDANAAVDAKPGRPAVPRLKKDAPQKSVQHGGQKFQIGDSVTVYPQKEIGIIFKRSDERGMLGVQIKGKKQFIKHKRLKLLVPATELYPEDYDFSIVFDTVENRKARHRMEKGHQPGLTVTYKEDHDS
ncbi:endonuclease MutS2 [Paenibacillus sp. YN15]|uniref:endonuclease MutS2 n=1 Tax=Paenibacillus sp. YN15 TaxID=1742774 RepID=UPI000DCBF265|nr:DNA mismatch repair protein MutS [Paenibacillus sp. YN15]RAV06379.1 DNA mismatch repair protein MutS [Paenibacillus sp. YN15]